MPACVRCKARVFKGPAEISCVISYQDCISVSVCMTLPVLSRIKTHCCCQAYFHSTYSSSPLWLPFLSGVHHSFPLLTCYFPANHCFTCVIPSETSLGPSCLSLCSEKRNVSGACAVEKVDSCVNYHLAFIAWPVENTHADKSLHRSRLRACRFLQWPQ